MQSEPGLKKAELVGAVQVSGSMGRGGLAGLSGGGGLWGLTRLFVLHV